MKRVNDFGWPVALVLFLILIMQYGKQEKETLSLTHVNEKLMSTNQLLKWENNKLTRSIEAKESQIQHLKDTLKHQLFAYSQMPKRARTMELLKIDSGIVITSDSTAELNQSAIDSVNRLAITYANLAEQKQKVDSVVIFQDTIIQNYKAISANDSTVIQNMGTNAIADKKTIRRLKLHRVIAIATAVTLTIVLIVK